MVPLVGAGSPGFPFGKRATGFEVWPGREGETFPGKRGIAIQPIPYRRIHCLLGRHAKSRHRCGKHGSQVEGRCGLESGGTAFFIGHGAGLPFSQGLETRAQVFFRIFTMKEARVKAEDKGFGIPLNSFSIPLPPGEISTLEGWEYFTRNTPPGNVFLAHAVENQLEKPLEYNVREWNVESFKGFWAGCFPACNQR